MKSMRKLFLSGILIVATGIAVTGNVAAAPLFSGFLQTGNGVGAGRVTLVQSGDAALRLGQLQEQVRDLNGRIEELGFQLLQMQEQMRQMQQDNEFRFQELEKAGGNKQTRIAPANSGNQNKQTAATGLPGVEDMTTSSTGATGESPAKLGTLTFDENGNMVTSPGSGIPAANGTASLNSPVDLYQAGYSHMLAGDYKLAEKMFRDYVDIYPDGPQAADAMFWLGEAQYSQNRFTDAARTFLDAHKRYPQADKGADTMLKLGMSLAALDKREPACSTYREVLISYPGASPAVKKKVSEEQLRASC